MDVDLVSSGLAEEDAVDADDYNNHDAANFGGERCGICMDIIIDRGVLDCCQHWFCFVCIDNWATITNLCPLCQHEFQLITCVPVYDTIGSSKVDEDSYSRDDDWCIEGKNNTLSFPSYYIDENAVICLDGDGCKIRSGSASTEGDSSLDTSIACDSCDLWYHAFCVGFDPEGKSESTWLCPRCVVDEVPLKPDKNLEQGSNHRSTSENGNIECEAEGTYSKKVSISVADAGETAIVVSMVGGNKSAEELEENILPTVEVDKDLKTQTFMLTSEDNSKKLTETSGKTSTSQPILKEQELELFLSCDTSLGVDKSRNEHGSFGGTKSSLGQLAEETHFDDNLSDYNSDMGLHLGLSVGSFLSVDEMGNNGTEGQMNEDVKQDPSEEHVSKADKNVADAEEDASGTTGVKRKLSDSSDHIHMNGNGDAETETEIEAFLKKIRAEGRIQPILPKDQGIVSASDDSKNGLPTVVPSNDKVNVPEKENVTSDIMSIVQGTNSRPSKVHRCPNTDNKSSKEQENMVGLRVKKIMKRSAEDKESSMAVQKLRKEIREAVHNKSAKDIGENLFDPKLLAAFRAAVLVPKPESVTTLSHLSVKARKSMLQKSKVRENLTKKIYATSNGRRKRAWDRDCEVEFWKHRCLKTSKPEKIQTLKSVLDLLKGGSESTEAEQTSERQATNPILSRLYLADTSVFPRKDDIKPLSALKTSSDSDRQLTPEKCSKTSLGTSSSAETDKGQSKVGKKNDVSSLKGNVASTKAHPSRHSEGSTVSSLGSSKSNTCKEVAAKSDAMKKDKRKWALEVLTRKTSGAREGAENEKQEDLAVLKGSYPLLAQLPIDMRPALAPSRHNKIPISVRQAQLYRLTEHLLRKANLPVIRRTAETELAVADAINIEKEVADRSNSKPVYLNLCSQEILHRSENKSSVAPEVDSSLPSVVPVDRSGKSENELSTNPVIEEALKNAGLLSDSPPNSPDRSMEIQTEEGGLSTSIREEGPEDVFEMDDCPDLDIYGEFEYNLDDEDYIGVSAAKVSKVQREENASKMKVVFSTFHSERSSKALDLEKTQTSGNAEVPKDTSCMLEKHSSAEFSDSTMEEGTGNPCVPRETLFGEEGEELSVAECEELYGPDIEPLTKKFPEAALIKPYGLSDAQAGAENEHSKSHETGVPNQATKASELGTESYTEKSVSVGHNSSAGESSPNRSEIDETVRQREKKSNGDTTKRSDNSISKKVEAYIKEHIRPLCKSGVITAEQYRWAVAKATEKVMKYHCKAKNANFLIKEGEKVKKLAEQYVEAAKEGKR
ncbi:TNF receptor-associated factor [Parasponia andersonii]|uniref:TNF receptor-associated factor n=1 Tax=Parasponia andersonii TaxID=3476 RepID=A0A2P5A4S2_PARAD|nr:TNF receptor-associated factor [Parasponia andersonii]